MLRNLSNLIQQGTVGEISICSVIIFDKTGDRSSFENYHVLKVKQFLKNNIVCSL